MQIYLGSLYVNDFNKFGRTYRARAGDAKSRASADDVGLLKVRSDTGEMCRCRRCSDQESAGPERAMR